MSTLKTENLLFYSRFSTGNYSINFDKEIFEQSNIYVQFFTGNICCSG